MARQQDVRYVQFYTVGTAARKLEVVTPYKTAKLPKVKKQQKIVLRIDPIAVAGVITAVIMLTLMLVGVFQLNAARQRNDQMEQYVTALQAENRSLQENYKSSYDLEEIKKTAIALGMVPQSEVPHITMETP